MTGHINECVSNLLCQLSYSITSTIKAVNSTVQVELIAFDGAYDCRISLWLFCENICGKAESEYKTKLTNKEVDRNASSIHVSTPHYKTNARRQPQS